MMGVKSSDLSGVLQDLLGVVGMLVPTVVARLKSAVGKGRMRKPEGRIAPGYG